MALLGEPGEMAGAEPGVEVQRGGAAPEVAQAQIDENREQHPDENPNEREETEGQGQEGGGPASGGLRQLDGPEP